MAEPLLRADALTRHYRVSRGFLRGDATVHALSEVSFSLQAGQTLAVVGESGCGKSTLARQLTMIERPSAGALWLDGVDVAMAGSAQRAALRRQVQMVFQNPYASLNPRQTVAATLEEPLRINTALGSTERRERSAEWLARVGLRPEHGRRYPHMFSGGQRQRIAIARAMILQPRIACVFISHNLGVVEHMADRVMVMYLGRIVEIGDKRRLFARPLHPYTQALMSATPAIRAADRHPAIAIHGEPPSALAPPSGCAFHKRCPQASARCAAELPLLREFDGQQVACHRVEEWVPQSCA